MWDLLLWKSVPLTGYRHQTLGRWCIPVWRKASGALIKNSHMGASAPTTMCDFSVHQVPLFKQQVGHGRLPHAMNCRVKKRWISAFSFPKWLIGMNCLYPLTSSVQTYWTNWGEWSPCSTTACNDVGIQVRRRKCMSTKPMSKLVTPTCPGPHAERRECSTPACQGK